MMYIGFAKQAGLAPKALMSRAMKRTGAAGRIMQARDPSAFSKATKAWTPKAKRVVNKLQAGSAKDRARAGAIFR